MCWNWPRRPIKGLSDGMDDSIIRYASTKVEIYIGFDNMYIQGPPPHIDTFQTNIFS